MVSPTKEDVLLAVKEAANPDSNYIIDRLHRIGKAATAALVLRRLKSLAADGLLEQSAVTNGYYGYRWTITPAGYTALAART